MLKRGMKPSHPGAMLREDILKEMKLSITEAAKGMQVSRKQLSEIVNERAAISPEMAKRLEMAFGIDAGFWLDLQKTYDLWQIEQSGKVEGIQRFIRRDSDLSLSR
jgi:antitoxin HigA-1